MSINLWRLGGKPTSYNPLPSGVANKVENLSINASYQVTFRAKSASNAVLSLVGYIPTYKAITLTPDFVTYTVTFVSSENRLIFWDSTSKGDIIIDSITLVQKPLDKLTVNGLSNAVSDWEQGTINGSGANDNSLPYLNTRIRTINYSPIKPSTVYTINCASGFDIAYYIYDKFNTFIFQNAWVSKPFTFTTGTNDAFIKVVIKKTDGTNISISDISNINVMLNLGAIPAPYSPKTGDRMVMPTAKKNLVAIIQNGGLDSVSGANADQYFATAIRTDFMQIINGLRYYVSRLSGSDALQVYYYKIDKTFISREFQFNNGFALTVPNNAYYVRLTSANDTMKLQLEQGTVPTTYTPYNVQVNKQPQKYVPKKNLFDGQLEIGMYAPNAGTKTAASNTIRSINFIPVNGNTTINLWTTRVPNTYSGNTRIFQFDVNKNWIRDDNTLSVTVQPNCAYVTFHVGNGVGLLTDLIQLEQGSIPTSYDPYQLVLPPSRKGLSFNGVTDYLQLPSMTMDAIEVECLIDANQPMPSWHNIIDARTGLPLGYVSFLDSGSIGSGGDFPSVTGGVKGVRTKIKAVASRVFTDNVTIFSFNDGTREFTKGILYKVTCYLAGNIVAQYDFENAQNIVGNQVIPNAQNLIPSFDDARWSIHPNAKVLGKDVLHLDATANSQYSYVFVPTIKGNSYFVDYKTNAYFQVTEYDTNLQFLGVYNIPWNNQALKTFTVSNINTRFIKIELFNNTLGAGSFDFIKPQLYQLDGTQGTIYGAPVQLNKSTKRQLYAKR